MKIFRTIAMILPQLMLVLILGAGFDLLFGFNQTDTGCSTLLSLLVLTPAFTLIWFVVETKISIRRAKRRKTAISFLLSGLAFLLFIESRVIDIYVLSHFKM